MNTRLMRYPPREQRRKVITTPGRNRGRSINPLRLRLIPRPSLRYIRPTNKHIGVIDTKLDSPVNADWVADVLWEEPPVCKINPKMESEHCGTGSMERSDFIFVPHVPSFRGHLCRIGKSSRNHQIGDSDSWSLIGDRASARSSSSSLRMIPGSATETMPSLQLTRLASTSLSNSASGRGRTCG